jgi:hypothetical protein
MTTPYKAAVNLRTTPEAARRLRLTAAVRGTPICVLVTQALVLGRALPSEAALRSELQQEETNTDAQH